MEPCKNHPQLKKENHLKNHPPPSLGGLNIFFFSRVVNQGILFQPMSRWPLTWLESWSDQTFRLSRVAAAKLWSSVQQLQEQIQVAKNLDVMSKKAKEEKPPAYVVYIGVPFWLKNHGWRGIFLVKNHRLWWCSSLHLSVKGWQREIHWFHSPVSFLFHSEVLWEWSNMILIYTNYKPILDNICIYIYVHIHII